MSNIPWFTEQDMHLFSEGVHCRCYDKFGAHFVSDNGERGVHFAVWAPNARRVSVVGDFNNWDELAAPLSNLGGGIWEGFVPGVIAGQAYKYFIHSSAGDAHILKADPFAFCAEVSPCFGSLVWGITDYKWGDAQWMAQRAEHQKMDRPVSIYQVHLGSWRRKPEEGGTYLSYRQLAHELPEYVKYMGFTHVQLLPIMEHPCDATYGYQPLGFFAPTSRFGKPQDFMYLVDRLHQTGIGVIGDFVVGRFPLDAHGLALFDGTCLYERQSKAGEPEPQTEASFNFGRKEVVNFLLSSASFWLEQYHFDGLRINEVESLLYRERPFDEHDSTAHHQGSREDLEAVRFLQRFNEVVYEKQPEAFTIAEESTAWPMVSRPTYVGGLGFGYKWNVGWMADVLAYLAKDPIYRSYHHNSLTFSLTYAFQENYILPLPHGEVARGKCSLLRRMSGDDWQKFANLRLLLSYQYGHPGKKLVFMGGEFAQWDEWEWSRSLDWHLLQYRPHQGVQQMVKDLNLLLCSEPAMYEMDFSNEGFCWIDCHDHSNSVLSFLRRGFQLDDTIVCVYNFTPVPRNNYRVGVPQGGYWEELFNSDAAIYGGSGLGNMGGLFAEPVPAFGQPCSLNLTLGPLAAVFFRLSRG